MSRVVSRRVATSRVVSRGVATSRVESSGDESCRVESSGDEINNILKNSLEDKKITMLPLPLINEDNFSSSYPPFSFYVPLTVKQHN